MNRLELSKKIIAEGKKRKITITECKVYDRGKKEGLDFSVEIKNENAKDWIYEHQVKDLIADLTPIERPFDIMNITIADRKFKAGDKVEIDDIWIRLDAGEKEPKIINVGSGCGQYLRGWVQGKVVEINDGGMLVVSISRDIWIDNEGKYRGSVMALEEAMKKGEIEKIEKGQPLYCGLGSWDVRKV